MIKPLIKAGDGTILSEGEAEQIKFDIYLKNRQVTELVKIMEDVLLWPKSARKKWVKKFSPHITDMLDDFLEETVITFDGVSLDQELITLFAEFTKNLQTVTEQVEGVVGANQPIDA